MLFAGRSCSVGRKMQIFSLHGAVDAKAANPFLLRKPLSSHTGRCKLSSSYSCPCGKQLVPKERSHQRQHLVVYAAAATAAAPPSKTSGKKRKQVEPLLVVEDISKSHDGQRFLFESLSFTVSRGDRLALVGPNGAGKSSLFNLLSGMLARSLLWRSFCCLRSWPALCLSDASINSLLHLQILISQTLE